MRRCLVVGNWKMHGSVSAVTALVAALKNEISFDSHAEVAVCPPFVFISAVAAALADSGIAWGAQTLDEHEKGAFTGEISAAMLADLGCRYVIVGHSERRSLYAEDDSRVAAKFMAAQASGLIPILCVGENLQQREEGQALDIVQRQLTAVIAMAGIEAFNRAVVAYEPVWAIGTGKTATPEQAQQVHAHIRQVLSCADAAVAEQIQILYGGSVNAGNALELFASLDIDGALVGGASLKSDEFTAICKAGG